MAPDDSMSRPTLAAIVFDMDGTLIDSLAVVLECYGRTVLEFGGPDLSPDEILAAFSIGPAATMLSTLIGRDLGPDPVTSYESRLAISCDRVEAYEGIDEALATLAGHVPLGVFTAADTSAAELLLTATGLRRWLGPVLGGDRVARPKPWPDGLAAVCDGLGVAPSDVAYVGDGPSDVEVAHSCGAFAVAAGWGHQHRDDRGADVTLATPTDLLGLVAVEHTIGGER